RVGSFGYETTISPVFTHDARELAASLPESLAPEGPTPLWLALAHAIEAFGDADDRRKVILVLSDGKDTASFPIMTQAEVISRARRHDVMIYTVGVYTRSLYTPPRGAGR